MTMRRPGAYVDIDFTKGKMVEPRMAKTLTWDPKIGARGAYVGGAGPVEGLREVAAIQSCDGRTYLPCPCGLELWLENASHPPLGCACGRTYVR